MKKMIKYIGVASLSLALLAGCSNDKEPVVKDKNEIEDNVDKEVKVELPKASDLLAEAEDIMVNLKSFSTNEKYVNGLNGEFEVSGDIYVKDDGTTEMNLELRESANDSTLKYISKDNVLYMVDASVPDEWIKMEMNEEMLKAFKIGDSFDLTSILNFGGTSKVEEKDGKYIVTVFSEDKEKLEEELLVNDNILDIDPAQLEEIKEVIDFESASYTITLDAETKHLLSISSDVKVLNVETNEPFSVSTNFSYSNHNALEDFVLPEGAENAIDLTNFSFEDENIGG